MRKQLLKAPFPYFGGKSKVAGDVWQRFGDPDNYVEPFCGSAAMLLLRPTAPRIETINDADMMVANFWRATKHDPDRVVEFCDDPVNECDLHARHKWLVFSDDAKAFRERMRSDPDYFDPKIAGWWCWGLCCWIGSGWCEQPAQAQTGMLSALGQGIHGRPQLADAYDIGRGVHSTPKQPTQRVLLGSDGDRAMFSNHSSCAERRQWLLDWFGRLRDRLRNVRVCCGHWNRVCSSNSTTVRLGTTAVFLDPPYPTHKADGTESRSGQLYSGDYLDETDKIRDEVLAWCREWGPNEQMRIAVCGYDTDGYAALETEGWDCFAWKTTGGYGNRGGDNVNRGRERVWFSPHCTNKVEGFGLGR